MKKIERGAFSGCSIKKISIPEDVTRIPTSCFRGCDKLEEVKILGEITEIDGWAFDGCSSLKTINLPTNIKLGVDAFYPFKLSHYKGELKNGDKVTLYRAYEGRPSVGNKKTCAIVECSEKKMYAFRYPSDALREVCKENVTPQTLLM